MSVEVKARMAASAERAIAKAQAEAAERTKENLVKLSEDAKANIAIGRPTAARAADIQRERERKAYAAKRAPKIDAARAKVGTLVHTEPTLIVDLAHRDHMVRYFETGRDAGSKDNYWCAFCRHKAFECECDDCACAENKIAPMDRTPRKRVMVWDSELEVRRPALIDGQNVVQSHGYSPMRSRKFGLAKKTSTRWQRPTENAALGATPRGMWEGDDYVTLNMTTAQLAAFTVAHKFVMGKVPAYKGNAKQATLETMLAGSKGRDDTHSVRMFTAADLRKMGKQLPKKLKKGVLRPIFGDN
jgi:hypothetical protein